MDIRRKYMFGGIGHRQGRSGGGGGGKKGNCALPPELFSVTISLQTKILMLQRKSTNNASRGRLRPLFDKKTTLKWVFFIQKPYQSVAAGGFAPDPLSLWRLGSSPTPLRLGHPPFPNPGARHWKSLWSFAHPEIFGWLRHWAPRKRAMVQMGSKANGRLGKGVP